jgi:hypothetical protein
MKYLAEIDWKTPEFGDLYDELPLWSALFGLMLLEGAGFEFVGAVTRSFRERFVDGSSLLRHHFIRLGFVPGWKPVAPEGAVEQTFAALEQRLNAIAAERGGLSLTIPAACIQARKPAAR